MRLISFALRSYWEWPSPGSCRIDTGWSNSWRKLALSPVSDIYAVVGGRSRILNPFWNAALHTENWKLLGLSGRAEKCALNVAPDGVVFGRLCTRGEAGKV